NPTSFISFPEYRDIRDKNQSISGLIACQFTTVGFAASAKALPQMRMGQMVSDNFFRALEVQPSLGRAFLPDEGKVPGRDAITVLSYHFWETEFGSDRSVIGRKVRMNGIEFTVVGVASKEFTGADQWIRPYFYVPISMAPRLLIGSDSNVLEDRANRMFEVKARLKEGVSQASAQAEMSAIAANLEKAYPETNRNRSLVLRTEFEQRVKRDPYDSSLAILLMALVGLVLIIACANVANLLLARSQARSREIAIRLAIGAGRMRLLRQLLIESLALALLGCALGLGVAYLGIVFMQGIKVPTDIPVVLSVQLDRRVLFFTLVAGLLSALVFGLAPAWQALKTDLVPALRSAGLSASARRRTIGRNALVVSQVALSLVLLVAAGMLLEGFRKVLVISPGFRTDHILTMDFDTSLVPASERTKDFYRNLIDRTRLLPGVKSAALSAVIPLAPAQSGQTVIPEGFQFPKGQESTQELGNVVDDRYFDVMHTPIVRGRAFTLADKADSTRVAIVNEEFAKKYWANQEPIGKTIRMDGPKGPVVQVVGVAKTAKYIFIGEPPMAFIYLPWTQRPQTRLSLVVETYGDPAEITAPVRDVVRSINPDQPIYNARTLATFYEQRGTAIFLMILETVSAMGIIGLVLAVVGLYGLIAYSVSRRTQEIGIRMALGAQRSNVAGLVLRQGFLLAIIGVAIGFAASVAVRGALVQGLIGLGTLSPLVLAIVPIGLLAVTMAACYLPAYRASRIDPIRALRWE
ncbi:MAG TPA: ABC transporter permease, partial [Bryobacteraceae bacterium]|nr:ABC transporter permease [Bryobacteraceae bacterium]